jgi:AraC-like DNA-binding protein
MSSYYFCKTFKKVTGLNFTNYLARLRIEKAKELLLNPNARVSEIVFEVGFRSITHFNRIFKRHVGKSPTEYRE